MFYVDQLGNKVKKHNYKRIVSTVPSQTELLHHLGLGDRVVGITKFCIHPESWFRSKKRIGGTKTVDIDKVKALKPDLIIGNKEENQKEDIIALQDVAPVWMSDIYNLDNSLKMISELGDLLGVERSANNLINEIEKGFQNINKVNDNLNCLYLIWRKPYMGVAKNTFIDHVLTEQLGLSNYLSSEVRYPEINLEDPQEIENKFGDFPDFIFLSSEPFPFKQKHIDELKSSYPTSKFIIVDGEYFSWYGSRLKDAPKYFNKLLENLQKEHR